MAAAVSGNYETAGKEIGRAATTVKRQVEQLELWLHRVLVTDDVPLIVTPDGNDFIPTAYSVLRLIDEADLRAGLSLTRVQADGSVTIGGLKIGSGAALEIGQLMVASRAAVSSMYVPPPPVSPNDIDMSFFTSKA